MEKGDTPVTAVITMAIGAIFGTMLLAGIFGITERGGAQAGQSAELEFNEFVNQIESACDTVESGDYSIRAGSLNLPTGSTVEVDEGENSVALNDELEEEISCNIINSIEYTGTTSFSVTPSENGVNFR